MGQCCYIEVLHDIVSLYNMHVGHVFFEEYSVVVLYVVQHVVGFCNIIAL